MSNPSGAQAPRSAGPPAAPAAPGSPVRRVGLFGAGTIGSGWAATYLARGYEVLVFDPAASAEQRTRPYLDQVWSSVRRATPGAAASVPHANLRFVPADEAVRAVALVHENGPEDVTAKQAIHRAESGDIIIYTVSTRDFTDTAENSFVGEHALRTLAELTGGAAFAPGSVRGLNSSLAALQQVIRSRYLLSYKPAQFQRDGQYRAIDISAEKGGHKLHVYARKGYIASTSASLQDRD